MKHVFNTWLLALLFFPGLFLAYEFLCRGEVEMMLLFFLTLFASVYSLPALLLCFLLFYSIRQTAFGTLSKLCIWMLSVSIVGFLCSGLVFYLFYKSFNNPELIQFAVSAVIAALLSLLLRLPQFFNAINLQTKTHATNLV